MYVCVLSRGDFASPGSSTEAEMGADVEVDCGEGTNEHAVHLLGRPGKTHTSSFLRHANLPPFGKICHFTSHNINSNIPVL